MAPAGGLRLLPFRDHVHFGAMVQRPESPMFYFATKVHKKKNPLLVFIKGYFNTER